MEEIEITKIVSMVIQDLRRYDYIELIDLLKASKFKIILNKEDDWSGCKYYTLEILADYCKIIAVKDNINTYENILKKSIDEIYNKGNEEIQIIEKIIIKPLIKQFIDWKALKNNETKQSVLDKLSIEINYLINVGTGKVKIQEVDEDYKKLHKEILNVFKSLGIDHVNKFNDLWDWYNYYKDNNLSSYQMRRSYIKSLYQPLIDSIHNSEDDTLYDLQYEPTGWEKIDNATIKIKGILDSSYITEDYQAVGMYGRETLISLAQAVFNKEIHKSSDGTDIGNSDSKRMLESYINYCLKERKVNEREIKYAKSSIDFSNELTHNRTATKMDAELCYVAVISTINIIRIINRYDTNS